MNLKCKCLKLFLFDAVVLSFDSVVCANSEMSDLFFFLLSSLKRLTICRGSDQAVVPLQAQTLSKLRPSLVRFVS